MTRKKTTAKRTHKSANIVAAKALRIRQAANPSRTCGCQACQPPTQPAKQVKVLEGPLTLTDYKNACELYCDKVVEHQGHIQHIIRGIQARWSCWTSMDAVLGQLSQLCSAQLQSVIDQHLAHCQVDAADPVTIKWQYPDVAPLGVYKGEDVRTAIAFLAITEYETQLLVDRVNLWLQRIQGSLMHLRAGWLLVPREQQGQTLAMYNTVNTFTGQIIAHKFNWVVPDLKDGVTKASLSCKAQEEFDEIVEYMEAGAKSWDHANQLMVAANWGREHLDDAQRDELKALMVQGVDPVEATEQIKIKHNL